MPVPDHGLVEHMIQSLDRIAEPTSRIDEARLRADWVLQNALVHEMQVFGEPAGRLSDNLKDEFDDIPWRKVNGLRNRLAHEDFAVDLALVWDTATRDMPAIRSTVLDLRRRLDE